MRKFESFLLRKTIGNTGKIIFIDLAHVESPRGNIDISVGIKEKTGGLIGTNWRTAQFDVEDDFSIKEFTQTCQQFNIPCSTFCGENETYIL